MRSFVSILALALVTLTLEGASPGVVERVRAHRTERVKQIVQELATLVAIPNVASDSENIERNASHLVEMLAGRGFRTELLRVAGAPPAVFGSLDVKGAKRTITFYAHYDGQPVDASKWTFPPWSPTMTNGPLPAGRKVDWQNAPSIGGEWRLYGRSTSDDKAPIVAFLAAIDALRAEKIPLSVNVRIFLEGEEEAGSPHLGELLTAHREKLRSDLWIFGDGPVHQSRTMQVFYGVRGILGLDMTLYGPSRAVHSGHYGNWAPNPVAELAGLIAAMRDENGRILIEGFHDDVRPLTAAEKAALERVPSIDDSLKQELALGRTESEGLSPAMSVTLPALNLRGISGGRTGDEAPNAIPTEATASIDFRLVPDQTPEKVRSRLESFLTGRGYTIVHEPPDTALRREHPRLVHLRWQSGYPPARTALGTPLARAAVEAIREASGEVVEIPTLGGSLPLYLFQQIIGSPILGVPIVNHDNAQHAADENVRMQNLFDGIDIYANLLAKIGR